MSKPRPPASPMSSQALALYLEEVPEVVVNLRPDLCAYYGRVKTLATVLYGMTPSDTRRRSMRVAARWALERAQTLTVALMLEAQGVR